MNGRGRETACVCIEVYKFEKRPDGSLVEQYTGAKKSYKNYGSIPYGAALSYPPTLRHGPWVQNSPAMRGHWQNVDQGFLTTLNPHWILPTEEVTLQD